MIEGCTKDIALNCITVRPYRMRRLRPEKVDELAESIRAGGLLQPIVVRPWRDRYELVFGEHRRKAVEQLGHERIRAVVCDGLDADAALLAEIDENLIRAELSAAERALHLAERKRLYERLYPETKRGVAGGKARHGSASAKMSFAESTAKSIGKSKRTIQRETERAAKSVGITDVPGTSLDSPDELDALAKLPERVQRDLIKRAKAGERVRAKYTVTRFNRETRERELAAATEAASLALGKKLYAVIYADPPYRFVPYVMECSIADNHYPTMTTEAIKALTIPAADDAVLFLWSTTPMLPQAIETMQAWGFSYKSYIVWIKDRTGTGYWTLNRAELLLIGTRGNIPAPTPGDQPSQVIEAPRRRHSEKPVVFAEIIEKLYPNAPKLEMFARDKRDGWQVWGNEAPKTEAAE
jgi:N6-adenosine-specific RNA methylase IME4/ParB-like chromosome segregation protein Spo0J